LPKGTVATHGTEQSAVTELRGRGAISLIWALLDEKKVVKQNEKLVIELCSRSAGNKLAVQTGGLPRSGEVELVAFDLAKQSHILRSKRANLTIPGIQQPNQIDRHHQRNAVLVYQVNSNKTTPWHLALMRTKDARLAMSHAP